MLQPTSSNLSLCSGWTFIICGTISFLTFCIQLKIIELELGRGSSPLLRCSVTYYIVEHPTQIRALRLFNSNKVRKGRKKPVWEILQAPRQPDGKQCGYYVMRFMRQIIAEIETIERDGLRSIAAEYTQAEIDEVRSEVADCIQDHIYE